MPGSIECEHVRRDHLIQKGRLSAGCDPAGDLGRGFCKRRVLRGSDAGGGRAERSIMARLLAVPLRNIRFKLAVAPSRCAEQSQQAVCPGDEHRPDPSLDSDRPDQQPGLAGGQRLKCSSPQAAAGDSRR